MYLTPTSQRQRLEKLSQQIERRMEELHERGCFADVYVSARGGPDLEFVELAASQSGTVNLIMSEFGRLIRSLDAEEMRAKPE